MTNLTRLNKMTAAKRKRATSIKNIETIEAEVLSLHHVLIHGTRAMKAIVKVDDASEPITCLWRSPKANDLATGVRYSFTGAIRLIAGRHVMFDAQYAISRPPTVLPAKAHRATGHKVRNFAIAAAIMSVIGIGIFNPSSSTSSQQKTQAITNTPALTTNAAAAVPKPKQIETPDNCDVKTIAHASSTTEDATLAKGLTKEFTAGVDGQDKLCYVHGRGQEPTVTHITLPVDQVTLVGTRVAPKPTPPPTPPPYSAASCDGYINVDGNCIPSPSATGGTVGGYTPTFTCVDGTFSYAQHSQGACSHHGGIKR